MSRQQSLILITVDCLRADHVGFLGYKRPTTPFLDSLAETSVVFSNAIVGGAPTYYSFPAIMASRHPLDLGRDVVGLAPEEETMASALRESGYSTGAFLAGNPYLSPRFGYQNGFDTFRDFLEIESQETQADKPVSPSRLNQLLQSTCRGIGLGAAYDDLYFRYCQRAAPVSSFDSLRRFPSADVIVDCALEWLATVAAEPFFLWLHFMDPHSPYYPKQEALQSLQAGINPAQARYVNSFWNRGNVSTPRLTQYRDDVVSLYDAGIRWVDSQIGRLASDLTKRKLWEHCTLAVTADHGEEFLEHGGRYHSPSKLTEELIHVPLLLHGPERSDKTFWDSPFSLIHLAPTLLDVANVPVPSSFRGRSYWKKSQEANSAASGQEHAVVESIASCSNPFDSAQRLGTRMLVVREREWKLVIDFAASREELFDLKNDPGEVHPLPLNTDKPARRRLVQCALKHIQESASGRDPGRRLDAQLRDLRLAWEVPGAGLSV